MNMNIKAAAAGALALAGMLTLPFSAAEAKTWRQWANQYGGGSYVDKYANDYVGEDKNGKTYYKGSKHDKYSGEYYNNKTGKWTGKKDYDGEYGGKSSKEYSSNSSKSKSSTASAGSAKPTAAKTVSAKPAATTTYSASQKSSKVVAKAPVEAADDLEAGTPPAMVAPKKLGPQARLAAEGELYGPPMPAEFATASTK